jgi:Leucine-rich repeat (LRR) protein
MPPKKSLLRNLAGFLTEGKQYLFACCGCLIVMGTLLQKVVTQGNKLKALPWHDPWTWGEVALWLLLLFIFPGLVYIFTTRRRLKEQKRQELLVRSVQRSESGTAVSQRESDYFFIGPYDASRHDRFQRADGVHLRVLAWIKGCLTAPSDQSILVLSGNSGTGKSSLLEAFVIPELRKSGIRVATIRGGEDVTKRLHTALLEPRVIWKDPSPHHGEGLLSLLQKASRQAPLVIVCDQFEEIITLDTKEATQKIRAIFEQLRPDSFPNCRFLLSLRREYEYKLGDVGIPALRQGDNWETVPPFSYTAARDFISNEVSGISIPPSRLQRVLKEAMLADDTKGFIRPIILNMLGRILIEIADSPEAEKQTRTLLLNHLRRSVEDPELKTVARAVLPLLLTESDTCSVPKKVQLLADGTGLHPYAIDGCLRQLAIHGYVRASQSQEIGDRLWGVSHDFVARLIGQVLRTPLFTLWERTRPVLYGTCVTLSSAFLVTFVSLVPWLEREHARYELRDKYGWDLVGPRSGYKASPVKPDEIELGGAVPYFLEAGMLLELDLSGCRQLTSLPDLSSLKALKKLNLNYCEQLTSLPDLSGVKALKELRLERCEQLTSLSGLFGLTALKELNLEGCEQLTSLPDLSSLTALQKLNLKDCKHLTSLPGLSGLKAVEKLNLDGCEQLTSLSGLSRLTALEKLDLRGCKQLTSLPDLSGLTALQELSLTGCEQLTSLPDLSGLTVLQELSLTGCTQWTSLPGLSGLTALQKLDLNYCTQLTSLPDLCGLKALQKLNLDGCEQLTSLSCLSRLKALKELSLDYCTQLTSLPDLSDLEALQELSLNYCTQLTSLPDLSRLKALKELSLNHCTQLTSLPDLSGLKALQELSLVGCNLPTDTLSVPPGVEIKVNPTLE